MTTKVVDLHGTRGQTFAGKSVPQEKSQAVFR